MECFQNVMKYLFGLSAPPVDITMIRRKILGAIRAHHPDKVADYCDEKILLSLTSMTKYPKSHLAEHLTIYCQTHFKSYYSGNKTSFEMEKMTHRESEDMNDIENKVSDREIVGFHNMSHDEQMWELSRQSEIGNRQFQYWKEKEVVKENELLSQIADIKKTLQALQEEVCLQNRELSNMGEHDINVNTQTKKRKRNNVKKRNVKKILVDKEKKVLLVDKDSLQGSLVREVVKFLKREKTVLRVAVTNYIYAEKLKKIWKCSHVKSKATVRAALESIEKNGRLAAGGVGHRNARAGRPITYYLLSVS